MSKRNIKLELEHTFDSQRFRHTLEGIQAVLHCHHYVTLTTRLAEEIGFADGKKLLREATEDSISEMLKKIYLKYAVDERDTATRLSLATQYFSYIGLGKIEIQDASIDGGTLILPYSHVDQGWKQKWGQTDKPINYIGEGFACAIFSTAFNQPPRSYIATEERSIAMGAGTSVIKVKRKEPEKVKEYKFEPHRVTGATLSFLPSGIDREKVIKDLSPLVSKVRGNEEGLIPSFGVLVNFFPSSFWNGFAIRVIEAAHETKDPEILPAARFLLRQCAHECGFHTGYGIITSPEWNAAVAPMIRKKNAIEDTLHGAYAIFTAWGWANSAIKELIPNELMIVDAVDYYEADGAPPEPFAFMIQGVCGGFLDLGYGGGYPKGLGTFVGEQTKGIEVGDNYGEFETRKATEKMYK